MKAEDIPLHYSDDARSMHTLLRVLDDGEPFEVLFDNLATVVALIAEFEYRIVEETLVHQDAPTAEAISVKLDGVEVGDRELVPGVTEAQALAAWREHASGSTSETLLIVVHGDPQLLQDAA